MLRASDSRQELPMTDIGREARCGRCPSCARSCGSSPPRTRWGRRRRAPSSAAVSSSSARACTRSPSRCLPKRTSRCVACTSFPGGATGADSPGVRQGVCQNGPPGASPALLSLPWRGRAPGVRQGVCQNGPLGVLLSRAGPRPPVPTCQNGAPRLALGLPPAALGERPCEGTAQHRSSCATPIDAIASSVLRRSYFRSSVTTSSIRRCEVPIAGGVQVYRIPAEQLHSTNGCDREFGIAKFLFRKVCRCTASRQSSCMRWISQRWSPPSNRAAVQHQSMRSRAWCRAVSTSVTASMGVQVYRIPAEQLLHPQ